jgi:hypothetical protein
MKRASAIARCSGTPNPASRSQPAGRAIAQSGATSTCNAPPRRRGTRTHNTDAPTVLVAQRRRRSVVMRRALRAGGGRRRSRAVERGLAGQTRQPSGRTAQRGEARRYRARPRSQGRKRRGLRSRPPTSVGPRRRADAGVRPSPSRLVLVTASRVADLRVEELDVSGDEGTRDRGCVHAVNAFHPARYAASAERAPRARVGCARQVEVLRVHAELLEVREQTRSRRPSIPEGGTTRSTRARARTRPTRATRWSRGSAR